MITKNGTYFLENLDLEKLAADRAYEFAFVFAPLRLKGAIGRPGWGCGDILESRPRRMT